MKKIYKKPIINLVAVETTSLLNDASLGYGGTGGGNTAEVKRHIPVIIDDDEEYEELEEATAIW